MEDCGNCKALKIVKFLSGGEFEIVHCSFRGCDNLKDVDLSDDKILRASCFAWCPSLEEIFAQRVWFIFVLIASIEITLIWPFNAIILT